MWNSMGYGVRVEELLLLFNPRTFLSSLKETHAYQQPPLLLSRVAGPHHLFRLLPALCVVNHLCLYISVSVFRVSSRQNVNFLSMENVSI